MSKKINFKSLRDGFSEALIESAKKNKNIVALSADLTGSLKLSNFKEELPKQFYQVGICEQNMASAGCGMAKIGKIPFICSYAVFSPGRNWDQIRVGACYSNLPLKIVGGHAGLTTGADGATHQALEDIALMRVLPNMEVYSPADPNEAYLITKEMCKNSKPNYLRLNRINQENIEYVEPFKFQKARLVYDGTDCLIVATGITVEMAKKAAQELEQEQISCKVLNFHSIKPLDSKRLIKEAKLCGCVVSCEEHQIQGGFGSAISEILIQNVLVPQEIVGVNDSFGESGKPDELLQKYNISVEEIKEKVKKAISRKNN